MSYRRREFNGPREMHKAVCTDCGNECEVTFKPDPSRPVFCRGMLAKETTVEKVLMIGFNQSFLLIS